MEEAKIFEEIYRDYLEKVLNLNRLQVRDRLGVQIYGMDIIIILQTSPMHWSKSAECSKPEGGW